jgi:glycyl-tRNA synthetase
MAWHLGLGLSPERLHFHQHTAQELAHYARAAFDVQFDFGGTLGFQEIEGIHNRSDFDLTQHQQFSGKKLEYFDQPNNKRYVPYVVETSVGADRVTLAALVNAYREEAVEGEDEGRVVLGLAPFLAPIKAAVFPLTKKDGQPEMARRIQDDLRGAMAVDYDETGSIGKRYRRQDEVGTPFCITVDPQSTGDDTVTVRERDSLAQERVGASAGSEVELEAGLDATAVELVLHEAATHALVEAERAVVQVVGFDEEARLGVMRTLALASMSVRRSAQRSKKASSL